LGFEAHIRTIVIVNREDGSSDRLKNYNIRVGPNEWSSKNPTCNSAPLTGGGVIDCDLKGRYITI